MPAPSLYKKRHAHIDVPRLEAQEQFLNITRHTMGISYATKPTPHEDAADRYVFVLESTPYPESFHNF